MLRKKISQVLARGGATVHGWTLLHLVDNTKARSPLQDLTHVFVDPRQLIQDPNLSRVLQGWMTFNVSAKATNPKKINAKPPMFKFAPTLSITPDL